MFIGASYGVFLHSHERIIRDETTRVFIDRECNCVVAYEFYLLETPYFNGSQIFLYNVEMN